jgi:AraC family transcriptional regulator
MQKPGDLLESVLNEIEKRIKEDINADFLADNAGLSSIHLQRLFKFAFNQSLGAYIRSRKLTASLESLFNTDLKLLNIALEYGFDYEQSYLRSFKREFGVTPGIIRKTGQIVKVTPPLNLHDATLFENCILFKPEIVMVPRFHVIGREHQVPRSEAIDHVHKLIKHFWENERNKITDVSEPDVYIGLVKARDMDTDYNWYLPSIQVKTLKNIPEGFESYTLNPSLYAKFRYIGQHNYLEINQDKIINIYSTIKKFFICEYDRDYCLINGTYFVKVYGLSDDENFCQVEWFVPIKKKAEDDEKC